MGIGIGEESMSVITVKKSELVAALAKNREAHRDVFIDAQKGYREKVIEELDRRLRDAREGRAFDVFISLEAPVDHTKDYDRILRMLEMCTKDEIFITEQDFAQYVLDDWGWKSKFIGTARNYTHKAQ